MIKTRVYKYEIPIADHIKLDLPKGARILSFQTQKESWCIWVLVNPNEEEFETRKFRLCGTGHDIIEWEKRLVFIGTAQKFGGDLVFHLFEIIEVEI